MTILIPHLCFQAALQYGIKPLTYAPLPEAPLLSFPTLSYVRLATAKERFWTLFRNLTNHTSRFLGYKTKIQKTTLFDVK